VITLPYTDKKEKLMNENDIRNEFDYVFNQIKEACNEKRHQIFKTEKMFSDKAFGSIAGEIFEDIIYNALKEELNEKIEREILYSKFGIEPENPNARADLKPKTINAFVECKKSGITGGYKNIDKMKKLQDRCIEKGFNFICIIGPGETNTYRKKTEEKGINAFWLTDEGSWKRIIKELKNKV